MVPASNKGAAPSHVPSSRRNLFILGAITVVIGAIAGASATLRFGCPTVVPVEGVCSAPPATANVTTRPEVNDAGSGPGGDAVNREAMLAKLVAQKKVVDALKEVLADVRASHDALLATYEGGNATVAKALLKKQSQLLALKPKYTELLTEFVEASEAYFGGAKTRPSDREGAVAVAAATSASAAAATWPLAQPAQDVGNMAAARSRDEGSSERHAARLMRVRQTLRDAEARVLKMLRRGRPPKAQLKRWAKNFKLGRKLSPLLQQQLGLLQGFGLGLDQDQDGAAAAAAAAAMSDKRLLRSIQGIIAQHPDPDAPPPQLDSFLWMSLAAAKRHKDKWGRAFVAHMLLQFNSVQRINLPLHADGATYLIVAAEMGLADTVATLLLGGADVNAVAGAGDNRGFGRGTGSGTALHKAMAIWAERQMKAHLEDCAEHDYSSVVRLLAHHPDLDLAAGNTRGRNAIWLAVRHRSLEALTALLFRQEDQNQTDYDGDGDGNGSSSSRIGSSASAAAWAADVSGRTPLHVAADVSEIVIFGAKLATAHGNHRAVRGAAAAGGAAGGGGAQEDQTSCVYNSVDDYHMTLDSILRRQGRPGASYNHTALRLEIQDWNLAFVDLLLQAGANPNAQDKAGQTPLHIAAQTGNAAAAQALLARGAVAALRDSFDRTPAALASYAGYHGLAAALAGAADFATVPESPAYVRTTVPVPVPSRASPVDGDGDGDGDGEGGWGQRRRIAVVDGEAVNRPVCDVDVRSRAELSLDDFAEEYFAKRRPVLIRGAVPGMGKGTDANTGADADDASAWDWDRLLVDLDSFPLQLARTVTGKVSETVMLPLGQHWAFLESEQPKLNLTHADATAGSDVIVEARWNAHPGLHARVMALLEAPGSAAAWLGDLAARSKTGEWGLNNYQVNIGGPFGGTSLHYHYATMSALVYGRKRWFLLPPADAFYSTRHFHDDFEALRQGRDGRRALECTQQSGDILFVPSLWGHGVLYEQNSVGASFLYSGGF